MLLEAALAAHHTKTKSDSTQRYQERCDDMAFEPKIIGFLCNWCSYTGADLAGVSRIKSAPNVRILRTMCSGRVDPAFVLKAFQLGADGVIVMGCHLGDCHYQEGNYKTIRRLPFLKRIVKDFGIDPRRLRLEWVSASEGDRFAKVVNEMTEEIRRLGPLKLSVTKEMQQAAAHQ
jgi:F420-non-reducing hydrogenase iron-sulfur subunit